MSTKLIGIALTLVLFVSMALASSSADEESHVVHLTPENYEELANSGKALFIMVRNTPHATY